MTCDCEPRTENSTMAQMPQQQPDVKLTATKDYRDSYANSVQVRVNVWDFFLVFGTLKQDKLDTIETGNRRDDRTFGDL